MNFPSIEQLFDLSGKVAVITGGAQGIGQAIALRLSDAGAKIMITDINLEAATQTHEQIKSRGGEARAFKADISSVKAARDVVQAALDVYDRLDILVNNAGGSLFPRSTVLETKEEVWDKVIGVNLKGCFFCSQAAAQGMIKAGRGGRIVNLASIAGFRPERNLAQYSASKAGVISLTKSLAIQLAPYHILVNAVAPGGIITTAAKAYFQSAGYDVEDAGKKDSPLTARMPLGRWGEPDEIARVVLFLVSGAADYMTGATVLVDGGNLLM